MVIGSRYKLKYDMTGTTHKKDDIYMFWGFCEDAEVYEMIRDKDTHISYWRSSEHFEVVE